MVNRVVSGGQTGVDRAALDVALRLGYRCGGWCPRGRKAEDGRLAARYPLRETPSDDYAQRTEWNVRDSEGSLIMTCGTPTGGTALTVACAQQLGKPYIVVDIRKRPSVTTVRVWARRHRVRTLNVAGPRASKAPGIYETASRFLRRLFIERSSGGALQRRRRS